MTPMLLHAPETQEIDISEGSLQPRVVTSGVATLPSENDEPETGTGTWRFSSARVGGTRDFLALTAGMARGKDPHVSPLPDSELPTLLLQDKNCYRIETAPCLCLVCMAENCEDSEGMAHTLGEFICVPP